jgi:hypothetical protein
VVEDLLLDASPKEAFWQKVNAAAPASLVLWLGANDLDGSAALSGSPSTVYLSSNLLHGKPVPVRVKDGANVRLIYPSDLPPKRDARLLRDKLWLHNKGIALTDETVQINTLFTMTVVSDVLGHIMDSFSRDLFVERIEHVVGQTAMASMYPSVSLGPGQRFAAKGSSIVQVLDAETRQMKALSGSIAP